MKPVAEAPKYALLPGSSFLFHYLALHICSSATHIDVYNPFSDTTLYVNRARHNSRTVNCVLLMLGDVAGANSKQKSERYLA